ncbi:hypothetical protein [Brevibacillus laterosporus]|nr:hypothetical protein [Brevibacillus laterosporus]
MKQALYGYIHKVVLRASDELPIFPIYKTQTTQKERLSNLSKHTVTI